jgi:hypothetical protein
MPDPDDHRLAAFLLTIAQHIGASSEGCEQFPPAIAQGLADLGKTIQLAGCGLDAKNGVAGRLGTLPGKEFVQAFDVSQGLR